MLTASVLSFLTYKLTVTIKTQLSYVRKKYTGIPPVHWAFIVLCLTTVTTSLVSGPMAWWLFSHEMQLYHLQHVPTICHSNIKANLIHFICLISSPDLTVRDFNAKHIFWGSYHINDRGTIVADITLNYPIQDHTLVSTTWNPFCYQSSIL